MANEMEKVCPPIFLPWDEYFSKCTYFGIFTAESPSFKTHIQHLAIRLKVRLGFLSESKCTLRKNPKKRLVAATVHDDAGLEPTFIHSACLDPEFTCNGAVFFFCCFF